MRISSLALTFGLSVSQSSQQLKMFNQAGHDGEDVAEMHGKNAVKKTINTLNAEDHSVKA